MSSDNVEQCQRWWHWAAVAYADWEARVCEIEREGGGPGVKVLRVGVKVRMVGIRESL